MSVFVLKVEKTFDLSCLPEEMKMCLKPIKLFSLEIKVFHFFGSKGSELDENLLTLFKKKTWDKIVIFGWIL